LIRYHKELIRVRKENPACRRGSGIPVYAKGGHFAFGRFLGDNHVLTIINNTEEAERMTIPVWQIEIPDGELFERQVLSMEEEFNLEKPTIWCATARLRFICRPIPQLLCAIPEIIKR